MSLEDIQAALKAPKNQHNDFGNYNYRSCEDILEAVKKLMGEDDKLTLSDKIVHVGDRYYIEATAYFNDVVVTAYAREAETKKGMDAAQITGSASSYARKYARNGLFLIDDARDDDTRQPSDFKRQSPAEDKPKNDDLMTKKQRDAIFNSGKRYDLLEEDVKTLVRWKAEQEKLNPKGRDICDFFIGKNDNDEWKMKVALDEYTEYLLSPHLEKQHAQSGITKAFEIEEDIRL